MNVKPAKQPWLPVKFEDDAFVSSFEIECPVDGYTQPTLSAEQPWCVIRMPDVVGGGTVRFLPIPIMQIRRESRYGTN